MPDRDLLIISCSNRKNNTHFLLPAIELYDGPGYRMLRKRLNGTYKSPEIWVLSAKHGLLWSDSHIYSYNERLTPQKAVGLKENIEAFIKRWAPEGKYKNIFIWAGSDYLNILPREFLELPNVRIATGAIGQKLHLLKQWCVIWQKSSDEYKQTNITPKIPNIRLHRLHSSTLNYFIPDWDDYLDPNYDFCNDEFSWNRHSEEKKVIYAHEIYKKSPLYDGILISLGHAFMGKGFARNGLKPGYKLRSARRHLHLGNKKLVMGDCGAFSYKRMMTPPFSTKQAIRLYQALHVDIGASIDHIPFGEVEEEGEVRALKDDEMKARVEMTARFGREMLDLATRTNLSFEPMGVIHGTCKEDYASIAREYVRAGYRYIALGGLVPKNDTEILDIAESVVSATNAVTASSVRVHLFGVLRQTILHDLKRIGICSFDSGSYLRKAWLRSDKNYLSPTGDWYCAIRIPYSNDARLRKNAEASEVSIQELERLERDCLRLLRSYDGNQANVQGLLDTIVEYDGYLLRTSDTNELREKYEKTLTDAPWKQCRCPICKALGIDVVIFRGFNRNKRRGFHNTRMFYQQLQKVREENYLAEERNQEEHV